MALGQLLALIGVWVAAIASPGPDVVQIARLGVKSRAAGVACAVGIMIGNTGWIAASLLGLSALIQAAPEILAVLQLVGGAYLLWMGIGAVRAGFAARKTTTSDDVAPAAALPTSKALRIGIATNLSNPKAVLFFGAVFAQFVKPGMGWEWMLVILLTLVVIGFAWFVGFALLVDKVSGFLDRYGHVVDVVTGLIFVALALWMIVEGASGLLPG
ncbi:LysE family translocator [uncultured Corynebacterium sp.]|uniref:LysE family translocator n=1 Tax=uncultured Corynebacterium sp. TaxID=159447 RepID=UPI002607F407|nr:LysE family translocator [uncultured Corynebacterium sp.]